MTSGGNNFNDFLEIVYTNQRNHNQNREDFSRFPVCGRGPVSWTGLTAPILSVFPALIVHSELKSVHPGFPVAFIFQAPVN